MIIGVATMEIVVAMMVAPGFMADIFGMMVVVSVSGQRLACTETEG